MVWSNKKFERATVAEQAPPPPNWLVWECYRRAHYDFANQTYVYTHGTEGSVRHEESLHKCKTRVGRTDHDNSFFMDWIIFEHVDGKWVERWSGQHGDLKDEHPLWKIQVKNPNGPRKSRKQREREAREAEHAELLAEVAASLATPIPAV